MRDIATLLAFLACAGLCLSQVNSDSDLQVREDDGGPVVVRTAGGVLNQSSSLRRRWISISDPSGPVRLDRTGVFARHDEKERMLFLFPVGSASPKQAISAIEVRYLLFDVWGQRLRTLSLTRLADSSTVVDLRESTGWPAAEPDTAQLVTVVSFVARVRTAEGQVWTFNPQEMLAQIQTLGLHLTDVDLIPDERRPISPNVIFWTYYPATGHSATEGDPHL